MRKTKTVFNMIWVIENDLPRRTALNNVLHDKAFNITKTPKYDE